MNRCP